MKRTSPLKDPMLLFAVAVWALSVLYFALVAYPAAEASKRIIAQAQELPLPARYAQVRFARAQYDKALAEVRARESALNAKALFLDDGDQQGDQQYRGLSGGAYATINRLATAKQMTINAIDRSVEAEQSSCTVLPVRVSGAWNHYLAFRRALTSRAIFVQREVITPSADGLVTAQLMTRACRAESVAQK